MNFFNIVRDYVLKIPVSYKMALTNLLIIIFTFLNFQYNPFLVYQI